MAFELGGGVSCSRRPVRGATPSPLWACGLSGREDGREQSASSARWETPGGGRFCVAGCRRHRQLPRLPGEYPLFSRRRRHAPYDYRGSQQPVRDARWLVCISLRCDTPRGGARLTPGEDCSQAEKGQILRGPTPGVRSGFAQNKVAPNARRGQRAGGKGRIKSRRGRPEGREARKQSI